MKDSEELQKFLTPKTRELLDFIYDGVYVVDRNRRIHFWSRGAEAITGHSKEEVMGKCCRDDILNHIDENGVLLCRGECPLVVAIKSNRKIEEKVFPLHKDKHRFPTLTHVAPIKNKQGKIIGAIEIFRDISSEEELRILQEKFQKLIKQYVSETTYEKVIESVSRNASMKATLKELTILFMDIVGFTTISEKHSTEEIVTILNSYFGLSAQVVKQNTGDVDKFIGDGVMALFIDAQDAVNAAKAILFKGLPVIGDAVNTASRIESVAEPGNFMISEGTLARIKNREEFEFSQEIVLKGKSEAVKLYRFKKTN
jgi:PAS domain S-box-containing protein